MRKRFGRHIAAVANIPQRHIGMGRGMMRSNLASPLALLRLPLAFALAVLDILLGLLRMQLLEVIEFLL